MSEFVAQSRAEHIEEYIRGAYRFEVYDDHFVYPSRMGKKGLRACVEAGLGEPASATAGVVINLVTTGSSVAFDVVVRTPVSLNAPCMVDAARLGKMKCFDGIDCFVDGVYHETLETKSGKLIFSFDNPAHAPREVRLYLPCLANIAVGNLEADGDLTPAPSRDYLLVLGDSITQGYIVGSPSNTWPARVARACGLNLLNQAVAGHHFDAATLAGLKRLTKNPPAAVIVAYGTNDWSHSASFDELYNNMVSYLTLLREKLPIYVPLYVMTPVWRADEEEDSAASGVNYQELLSWRSGDSSHRPCGKTLDEVREAIKTVASQLEAVRVIDGKDLVDKNLDLYADGRLHPNAEGASQIAEGVLCSFERDGLLQQWGGRQDSAVALADAQSRLRKDAPGYQRELDEAVRTIWRLRQSDGCPWDREQTHQSIGKNMIEEAYEALDTIEQADTAHLREELGDVLMQVLLHAQIAQDNGEFSFADVAHDLNEKLVRRHPHVFGDSLSAASADEVLDIWTAVKLDEQHSNPKGLLDAVPKALPSLMQAQKISKKAAACGFDWETIEDVWHKVEEERLEFEAEEQGSEAAAEEFGDILFTLVNVARKAGIDAEMALRASCEKFRRRWAFVEEQAKSQGTSAEELPQESLEELWKMAKRTE